MNPPTIASVLFAALSGILPAASEGQMPTPQELEDAEAAKLLFESTSGWIDNTVTQPDTSAPGSVLALNSYGKVQMAPALVVAGDAVLYPHWQPLPDMLPA